MVREPERDRGKMNEQRQDVEALSRGADPQDFLRVLLRAWWKILAFSLAAGVGVGLATIRMPDIYRATAVIAPSVEEGKSSSPLGALASVGILVGGASKVEDIEGLFDSRDLTVRVFRKYNLWPIVLGDRYDPNTGTIRPSAGGIPAGKDPGRIPGDWDAIRAAKEQMTVSLNRKAGSLSISYESFSPEGSARILEHYLEEGKSRLQEEALARAVRNKKFIEEQIARTPDPLVRDRLFSLYGQETEKEMLARNREQFGFKVIDSARAPDRKSRPRRGMAILLGFLAGFVLSSGFFLVRNR
jgi:uncharacterized protein involved in exopolysaccharide biosynthesis